MSLTPGTEAGIYSNFCFHLPTNVLAAGPHSPSPSGRAARLLPGSSPSLPRSSSSPVALRASKARVMLDPALSHGATEVGALLVAFRPANQALKGAAPREVLEATVMDRHRTHAVRAQFGVAPSLGRDVHVFVTDEARGQSHCSRERSERCKSCRVAMDKSNVFNAVYVLATVYSYKRPASTSSQYLIHSVLPVNATLCSKPWAIMIVPTASACNSESHRSAMFLSA